MDIWFVAAAAGADYVAQHLKNIRSGKHKMLSSENLNLVKQELPEVLPKIQDERCPLYRVLSSENFGERNCTEKEPGCQDASGAKMVSNDEFQSEILPKDSSSLAVVLRKIQGHCEDVVSIDDFTDDSLPQPSTREIGFSYDFRKNRSNIRSRQINRQFIKPQTSLESCLMAHLFGERPEIEENVNSVHRSNKPTMWPFPVTEKSLMSREPCSSSDAQARKCKLLKERHLEANNAVLGVPRLTNVVPMELQENVEAKTGKKHILRRNSSTMVNGNHKIAQGSSDGVLLFYLGLTVGMVSSFLENKREMEKLNKLLKHKENLVQDLQEGLEIKDSLTVKELAVEDYESGDEYCDQMAEKESLRKIEAELEAELERLESNMNSTRFEGKLSNVTELDPDFVSEDVTVWELKADLFDAKKNTRPYADREGISPPSTQYPISPRELSLRLHEVIQSRLEKRVVELETALENSQKKQIIGTSPSQDCPVLGDKQKYVELNLSRDTLAAYNEAYEVLTNVSESDEEDFPFRFEKRNDHRERVDKWKQDVVTVQDGATNVYSECSNGYVETEINLRGVRNLDIVNDNVFDSRDVSEEGEEEMERWLIRQIVEKAKQGSPVVLNAQKALLSSEQIKFDV